jgi:hypothetical protein
MCHYDFGKSNLKRRGGPIQGIANLEREQEERGFLSPALLINP